MKTSVAILLTVCIVALFIRQSAAVSCYICSSVSTDTTNPCNPPLDASKAVPIGGNATSTIYIEAGCTACETATVTISGVTTYARSCSSTTLTNQCATSGSTTSCVYTCSTELCNTTSGASAVRLPLLALLVAAIISAAFKST